MSGMGLQLATLVGVLVVLALIVMWLRRASANSKKNAPQSVQERLGVAEAPVAPRRHRQRPWPSKPQKPTPKPMAVEEEDDEEEQEEEEEEEQEEAEAPGKPGKPAVADAESTAAYKAGLAKTRGGFVAKLGKLFGKKKIDAGLLEELEEVLFTADIGPRAADRIFQSV